MRFIYGKQDMKTAEQAQENCYLLTNGLGGYSSLSMAYSATRNDQGLLISASTAPTVRHTLVQRMLETLQLGSKTFDLSTQEKIYGVRHHKISINSAGKIILSENGYTHLTSFIWEDQPKWLYELCGITVKRQITMRPEHNTLLVRYEITNHAEEDGRLTLQPAFLCAPKGQTLQAQDQKIHLHSNNNHAILQFNDYNVFIGTDANLAPVSPAWEHVFYRHDLEDGRTADGYLMRCMEITIECPAGEKATCSVILSDREVLQPEEKTNDFDCQYKAAIHALASQIQEEAKEYRKKLESNIFLRDPVARQLAVSADAYITRRDSTGGKTIVAGYPFFADWGRDTMISLPGCTLANGQYDTAESILRTFLEYEQGGLVPNLFPEGGEAPRYNTVDAALLLINSVWLYYQRTHRRDFLAYAYPIMQRIIQGYRKGSLHGIHMDEDGLIAAGQGLDQVTWMDVCVEGILPTPRHGKPVEINAYWYNALRIMAEIARILPDGEEPRKTDPAGLLEENKPLSGLDSNQEMDYLALASRVRESFLEKFWIKESGYLRDVISETHEQQELEKRPGSSALAITAFRTTCSLSNSSADEQIRCNQIWAITLPYTMLSHEQEVSVVNTVYRKLYTPCGLRTLDPEDPQFHPTYGGPQKDRDLAYHQGTTWVFPLGAFYKAYLKSNSFSDEAKEWVRERLAAIEPMLREGCIGQLPEIYDGLTPGPSRGCFAQAWSVGEILSVYEMLEQERSMPEQMRYMPEQVKYK